MHTRGWRNRDKETEAVVELPVWTLLLIPSLAARIDAMAAAMASASLMAHLRICWHYCSTFP